MDDTVSAASAAHVSTGDLKEMGGVLYEAYVVKRTGKVNWNFADLEKLSPGMKEKWLTPGNQERSRLHGWDRDFKISSSLISEKKSK